MKKLALCFIMLFISCSVFASFVFAEDNVVESPNVKIVIDGKIGTYQDVPIIVNGRTMLPLREVLVNLGVQNDSEHIIWDGVKRSVTIIKDSKNIYLEVGNKTARVDGAELTLDVEPMIYSKNNRTYIPARFVAESLGKKVIWDGSTTSVLIRDESKFNEIKDILNKSDEAMKQMEKYKFDMRTDMDVYDGAQKSEVYVDTSAHMDTQDKSMYLKMDMNMGEIQGVEMNFLIETYLKDNVSYSKTFMTGDSWIKSEVSEEELQESINENNSSEFVEVNDVLCAGLVATETDGEILLKGDVYIDELFEKGLSSSTASGSSTTDSISDAYNLDKFNVEMSLDKNTYKINNMKVLFDAKLKDTVGKETKFNMIMDLKYSYEDFEIVVPEEVINNAVDGASLDTSTLFPQQ